MSTELQTAPTNLPATKEERKELIGVLRNSLYPGSKDESIGLVIDYCHAASLDPMLKPVHIVPMSVKTGNKKPDGKDEYEMRDVIMPGVGLYRIQAARSGDMAGISEPEFGPDVTQTFTNNNKNETLTFPEWCKVTVKKVVGDHIVEFVAKEYWIENYATAGNRTDMPNRMWLKRKRGQIAKCAEAQALRKAWPEIGQAPTAEEMEGKVLDFDQDQFKALPQDEGETVIEAEIVWYPPEKFDTNLPTWKKLISEGKRTYDEIVKTVESIGALTDEQKKQIKG